MTIDGEANGALQHLFSEERVHRIRLRYKARRLTEYCLACDETGSCGVGRRLTTVHQNCCVTHVGADFRHCASCSLTLTATCPIDQAALADALHRQLAHCTDKRRTALPLCLIRFDVLTASAR